MKNFVEKGGTVVVTAVADTASGDFVRVGALGGVAVSAALAGQELVLDIAGGVYSLPKATGAAWAQGDYLYWDATAKKFTKVAAGNVPAGTAHAAAEAAAAVGNVLLPSAAAGLRVVGGQVVTASANEVVVTGLSRVLSVVATLEDAPVIGCDRAQAAIGDQNGAPAAGSIQVKTFKPTATGDATPVAATTFGKKVNWLAIGI